MFRYIAGNSIKHALRSSQGVIRNSKIPIINFAVEETSDKLKIYTEHKSLLERMDSKQKIAIKLSSFEFDLDLINKLIHKSSSKGIQCIIDAEKNIDYKNYQEISNQLIFEHNKENVNVLFSFYIIKTIDKGTISSVYISDCSIHNDL